MPLTKPLKIAIIGAGPAGLAQVIHLQRLADVELSVYEGATELKEVGAGIALNENTWRHLQLLGVADKIEQFFGRGDGSKVDVEHRNGRTGKVISTRYQSVDPDQPARVRIERYKLQNALLAAVPKGLIQLGKKLGAVEEGRDGVRLAFKDGSVAGPFDLVIGADGIRSVVRQHAFSKHKLSYTGKVAFRVLIPQSAVAHIPGVSELGGAAFWHTTRTHVYTNPLDNGLFEIATRAIVDEDERNKVSWGQVVPREHVIGHYSEYAEILRKIIAVPDTWLEFAMFGGPRLESVVSHGQIALIGDASHPLSGAFGSGAAFAFEDAYVLAQAIGEARREGQTLAAALDAYDTVRSPHYEALYKVLDGNAKSAKEVAASHPEYQDDDLIEDIIAKGFEKDTQWIYKYDVTKVWKERSNGIQTESPWSTRKPAVVVAA